MKDVIEYLIRTKSATDYYPFGMVMPSRVYSANNYRYGFNGKEKDDDIKGLGNSYDFRARIYDSRIGCWLSVDPLQKKYPSESPYSFAGNNPVSLTDVDGKEKTYYLTIIATDGKTITHLKVVEKYHVKQQTIETSESVGFGPVKLYETTVTNTKTFDLAQHITLDLSTGKVTVGKEYTTTERSNSAFVRGLEDNASDLGNSLDEATNGGGGIVFTSEIGQGQETRKGYNADANPENIDLLTAVIGAAKSAATSKQAKSFLESFEQGVDAIGILKDVKDNVGGSSGQGQAPANKDSCTFCGQTGTGLKTFKQGGSHSGPIVPTNSEKKKD